MDTLYIEKAKTLENGEFPHMRSKEKYKDSIKDEKVSCLSHLRIGNLFSL